VRLTDKQFAQQLLALDMGANEIIKALLVSSRLLKWYGKMLYLDDCLDSVKHVSHNVYVMLLALKKTWKLKANNIRNLIAWTKKYSEWYHSEFVVKADTVEHYEDVKKYLDGKFLWSEITQHTTKWNSIRISGEGRYYKRWLEQDVEKLLWL